MHIKTSLTCNCFDLRSNDISWTFIYKYLHTQRKSIHRQKIPQMKISKHFAKNTYMSYGGNCFPTLLLKKLKAFALIYIVSIRGRLNSAPLQLKTLEKFVQPANENFTTFCKKHAYESWRKLFPTLILKTLKAFVFICIACMRGRLNSGRLYLQTLKKFFQPANENFRTF